MIMAALTMKIDVVNFDEMKDLIISNCEFAYSDGVDTETFKANTKYLLEKMGISPRTYAVGDNLES